MFAKAALGCALLFAGVAHAEEWSKGDAVVHLTDANFEEYRAKNPKMFTMFYAPWCGHCKAMKPAFGEASAELALRMPLTAVDCTEQKETCNKFGVQGYPTIKYFDSSDGEPQAYEGGRDKDAIVAFLSDKAAELDLTKVDFNTLKIKQLKQLLRDRGDLCEGCTEKKDFVKRAKELADKPKTGPPEKKKKSGKSTLVNGRTFMQQRRYDEAKKVVDAGWEDGNGEVKHVIGEDLADFRKENEKFFMMFYAPWCGHCKKMKPEYVKASKELAGKMVLASIDCDTNGEVCKKYGATSYPTLKYFGDSDPKNKGQNFKGARDAEGIITFINNVLSGAGAEQAYGPYVNKPVWEENGEVFHVGDLHWKEFKAAHKNMFVMFYAPWCGHCKAFKPAFIEASQALADRKDEVALVAVDCTEEQETCQQYGVNGYPTIKWFAGSKVEDFNGARDSDSVVQFVEEKLGKKAAAKEEPRDKEEPGDKEEL